MPVDLFGQPADYRTIAPIAKREGSNCSATRAGFGGVMTKRAGAIGMPRRPVSSGKPLGCYGDGGACFTNDDALKERLPACACTDRAATAMNMCMSATPWTPSGGDPDEKRKSSKTRSKAQPGGAALRRFCRLQPHQDYCRSRGYFDLGCAASVDPPGPGRVEGGGANHGLLPDPAFPAAGLCPLSQRPRPSRP